MATKLATMLLLAALVLASGVVAHPSALDTRSLVDTSGASGQQSVEKEAAALSSRVKRSGISDMRVAELEALLTLMKQQRGNKRGKSNDHRNYWSW